MTEISMPKPQEYLKPRDIKRCRRCKQEISLWVSTRTWKWTPFDVDRSSGKPKLGAMHNCPKKEKAT